MNSMMHGRGVPPPAPGLFGPLFPQAAPNGGFGGPVAFPPPSYVNINGERYELMEDRRFALFQKFGEGVELLDPSFEPPRLIPMSTDPEEYGLTAKKLLPNGFYFLRHAASGKHIMPPPCAIIVHSLPPNTTAEALGKFFEQYDLVVEADVLHWQDGSFKPRGYVILQHPDIMQNILTTMPTVNFFDYVLQLEGADRHPVAPQQPPPYHQALPPPPPFSAAISHPPPSYGGNTFPPAMMAGPIPPGVVPSGRRQSPQSIPRAANVPTTHSAPITTATPPAVKNPVCMQWYYFVVHLQHEHIDRCIAQNILITPKNNMREFLSSQERGPVVFIVLLPKREEVFGYARLAPQHRDSPSHSHHLAEADVEWVQHSAAIHRADLERTNIKVDIHAMRDGIPLKPDIGQIVCELIDQAPKNNTSWKRAHVENTEASKSAAVTTPNSNGGGVKDSTHPPPRKNPSPVQPSQRSPAQQLEMDFPPLPST